LEQTPPNNQRRTPATIRWLVARHAGHIVMLLNNSEKLAGCLQTTYTEPTPAFEKILYQHE
jgi:hypothetical protein